MSLLGKLLLVVNLLAAAGFVYLATQNWKGRQSITAAGLRHQLLITGLPLDEERVQDRKYEEDEVPFVVRDGPGAVPTQTISKKILDSYFQSAPGGDASTPGSLAGGPVNSQIAEAKRVKAKIEDTLKNAPSAAEKVALLKEWLLWQAETYEERLLFQGLIAAGNADELEKLLLARFDGVINPPKAADEDAKTKIAAEDSTDAAKLADKLAKTGESRVAALDEGERRAKLAHLLVHLDTDAAWQKRVMMVVGLRRYVGAVAAQAQRFKEMTARVEKLIINDQGIDVEVTLPGGGGRVKVLTGFFGQEAINAQAARDATERAAHQRLIYAAWEKQKTEQDNRVAQRVTHLMDLENQLRKIKAEVDEMLARQAVVEAGLFEVQREVAITLDELYKLEAELIRRERERFGLPPQP